MNRIARSLLFAVLVCPATILVADPARPPHGWKRALTPVPMDFPRDHHAHPDYKTEWWYFTGNLTDTDGQRIGFQFTLFRQGISAPGTPLPDSAWAVRDFGFGHAALSLPAGKSFVFDQVLERGSLGSAEFPAAGNSENGLLAKVGDWTVALGPDGNFHMQAHGSDFSINLRASADSLPLLHGEHGLSRKAMAPGHASHYYSLPRLATTGTITCMGKKHEVRGMTWLDREWASSPLAKDQVGWDWFALQFNDGRDLMVYQMRRADGSRDPSSHGTLRLANGTGIHLDAKAITLTPTRWWRSPRSSGNYPVEWTLSIPDHGVHMRVSAVQDNQELALQPVTYYEGAIDATPLGPASGSQATGYMELTGYAAPLDTMRTP